MKHKNKIIGIFLLLLVIEGISLLPINIVRANSIIPDEYSQDMDLTKSYVYNITKFDSVLYWWGLDWSYKGDFITNPGGQIIVDFTGFYTKHVNDDSAFPTPAPYMNITFLKNINGILIKNGTLSNITNAETGLTLVLGFNYFKSGFIIPINNITGLIEYAHFNAEPGLGPFDVNGTVDIHELSNLLTIIFNANDGSQNNTLIYDINSGILIYAKVESLYGPDIEMFLASFFEEQKIPSFPLLILLAVVSVTSVIYLVFKKKSIKIHNSIK